MKPPYFPMYVRDMLSSMWVEQMDAEQFGWYIRMLLRSWDAEFPCHIPNDPETILMFAKANKEAFDAKGWLVIQRFKVTPDGKFLFNARLLAEFEEVMGSYKKRATAAQRSWKSRATQSNAHAMQSNTDGGQGYTEAEAEADTEADTKKNLKPSARKLRRAQGKPNSTQVAKTAGDSRHSRSEQIVKGWYRDWAGIDCPWDGAEAGNLGKILKAWPSVTDEQFARCLEHIEKSECIPKGTRPCEWLCKLPKFLDGPLDQFWKAKVNRNGQTRSASKADAREQRIVERAIKYRAVAAGAANSAGDGTVVVSRDGPIGVCGLDGEPEVMPPGKDPIGIRQADERAAENGKV